jgi:hypothetical protein
MTEQEPTIRSRELGEALRLAMERAGLSGKRVAGLLGWSETKVSRVLNGRLVLKEVDVSAFLAICMVHGAERDRLLAFASQQNTSGWLQQFGSSVPEQLRTLVNHESRATTILEFEPCFVPGLLQTNDYAQALLERSATVPPHDVESRAVARLGRQNVFNGEYRPRCTFYLHELIFYLPVGSRTVMSDQMHHLLQMSVRSYITIRVIPASFGAYAAVTGACRLMESAEFRPVVYVEEQTAGLFLEEPEEIATYRKVFAALADCALNERHSRDAIAELAINLYGEDHNGGA